MVVLFCNKGTFFLINICCRFCLIQTDAKIKAVEATLHLIAKHLRRVWQPLRFLHTLGLSKPNGSTHALLLVAAVSSKAVPPTHKPFGLCYQNAVLLCYQRTNHSEVRKWPRSVETAIGSWHALE